MPSYKKVNKKWSVVFDTATPDGKRRQKRLSGFASKPEAEMAYIAFKGSNKVVRPSTALTLSAVYDNYLTYKKTQLKGSSIVDIETVFDKFILPYLGPKGIEEISPAHIMDWQGLLSSKALSNRYRNKIYGYLKQIFKHAAIYFDTNNNPCLRVPKFKDPEAKKEEMKIWTPDEFSLVAANVEDKVYRAFFNFLFYSGARPGEAIAAKWKNLQGADIHIEETITRKLSQKERETGLTWKLTSVKNTPSDRIVTLPEKILDELHTLKACYEEKESFSDENFLFGPALPLSDSSINREKRKACEKANAILAQAGTKKRIAVIRNHDLRHSHASLLISLGFDIVSVAKRLGHKNIEMTLNTYGHMMPNKQKEIADKLDSL